LDVGAFSGIEAEITWLIVIFSEKPMTIDGYRVKRV
jgi:hypothetical protein